MKPTDEQQQVVDLAIKGEHLKIIAGAGTGKSTNLRMVGEGISSKRCVYTAFNRSTIASAEKSMPSNVTPRTTHSLAFGPVGSHFRVRLGYDKTKRVIRMKPAEVARFLGCEAYAVGDGRERRVFSEAFVATMATRAIRTFTRTADPLPTWHHVQVIEGLTREGNTELRKHVGQYLMKAWMDCTNPEGKLPYEADMYIKQWSLTDPFIAADVILLDECQDTNPPTWAAINAQRDHAQLIIVGDPYQSINQWRGSVDAMTVADIENVAYLTTSFRFGEGIAEQANRLLAMRKAPFRLTGNPAKPSSRLGVVHNPDALLCRTNAQAVSSALQMLRDGGKPAIIGGAKDVISFAYGAERLMNGERSDHHHLIGFETWAEVKTYVESDEHDDDDLAKLVELITRFPPSLIIGQLSRCADEKNMVGVDRVFSTAHKAKGLEWSTVRIADDFPQLEKQDDQGLNLTYVACTRAMDVLDAPVLGPTYRKVAA